MKKRKITFLTIGSSSILTIFAVLCFVTFALLSLSTARTDAVLLEKSADSVVNYYEADTEAEQILSQIRMGECPDTVGQDGNYFYYDCTISENSMLSVLVEKVQDEYKVIKWDREYTGEWVPDDSINLWDGTFHEE